MTIPKVGDTIVVYLPPPLTWWDRMLWRVFRISRQRTPVKMEFVITATNAGKLDD